MANPPHHDIPPELHRQLQEFRQHLWRAKILEALLAGFFGLFLSFLLVFGLDRAFPTPGWLRLVILLGGTSLFAVFAPYWIHRWVLRHRRENQLARLISRKFPRLGDRLLGVLELADQTESASSLSPTLRKAATLDVAKVAAKRDFTQALPTNRNVVGLTVVAVLFLLTGLAFVFLPQAGLNALQRWLMPLSDTPRYTLTKFDNLPDQLVVPLGEPFTLEARLSKNSETRPASAKARYSLQDWVLASQENGTYRFNFPPQQREGHITLAAGDARKKIRVLPTHPPTLESVESTISYPSYLEMQDRLLSVRAGTLTVVSGSDVRVHANASRALAKGTLKLKSHDPDTFDDNNSPKITRSTGRPEGKRLNYPSVAMGSHPVELEMTWTDVLGLESRDSFRLRLEPVADESPAVYVQGTERQLAILPEETVEFEGIASDDFGLKTLGLEWSGEFTKPSPDQPAKGSFELAEGSPVSRDLASDVAFSPAVYDISPQKLTLRVYAEDYLPERGRIYSQPIVLYILTRDEHAQMLKDRFDRIIGELEDTSRKEQTQLDENKRLERLDPGELQSEANQERLEEQRAAEQENVEKMEELSERMEDVFEDALRNGDIDKETMKKLSQAQRQMRELSQKDLPEVEEKLQDAQDQRSTPEKSQEDLKEAIEEQEEALEKMRETLEQANEANQNLEEATFINRLKKAAGDHDGIAATLTEGINRLIGRSPDELDPADERIVGEVTLQQKRTASDVRWIQEDLGHFYARTEKPIHKTLLEAMTDAGVDEGLERNRERLNRNLTFKGIVYSNEWATQLREWAEMLEGERNQNGGGGGGGGGGGSMEDQDFEFMLKVMRMIQSEQDIRARTRALEQFRRNHRPEVEVPPIP
ncbi:MAG: hypothetical protein Q7Q71_01800 [Verrucomicrobiota bacterium JB023]|nr:hypothetical protein [Verrucomicrobiota bacterium JB023]